jgi:hypothetical protein
MAIRQKCPAWEFQVANLCWLINVTICQGQVQESWQKKDENMPGMQSVPDPIASLREN